MKFILKVIVTFLILATVVIVTIYLTLLYAQLRIKDNKNISQQQNTILQMMHSKAFSQDEAHIDCIYGKQYSDCKLISN